MKSFFLKLDKVVQSVLRYLCIGLFAALGLLLLGNVFLRLNGDFVQFLHGKGLDNLADGIRGVIRITSFHWLDEIVELCFSALTFYGAAAIWAVKGHFSIGDWVSKRLPGRVSRGIYKIIVNLICITFLAVFFFYSVRLTINASELSTVFQIPKKVMYSSMPVSSFIMLVYSFAELAGNIRDACGKAASRDIRI
jgi:TRAP-type C4-dicarboxylate transport system permease small subunit